MSNTSVVAQRGASVLIRVDEQQGRILDMRHRRIFPAQSIESALARGYWEPFQGDLGVVDEALTMAEDVSATPPSESLLGESTFQTQAPAQTVPAW